MMEQPFPCCRVSFFNLMLALLFAAGLLIPSFTPTARSENLFVLGGGGGGGASISDHGGGGGAGGYIGNTDPGGRGGIDFNTGSAGGLGGTTGAGDSIDGSSGAGAMGFGGGGNGGNGGISETDGQDGGSSNGALGGRGGTSAGSGRGGGGGGGGGAGHTISGNSTYEKVAVRGGGGGSGNSGGGEAILNAGDLNVTTDIEIVGGTTKGGPGGSGSLNSVSLTLGGTIDIRSENGGANLIITNAVKAPTIKIANISNLAFNAGVLDITSNNTVLSLGGTVAGTNSIAKGDNGVYIGTVKLGNFNFTAQPYRSHYSGFAALGILELQGNGNLIDNDNLLTISSLTINGGTLNNANWNGLINHAYTISDISIGLNGATINIGTGEDKNLSRNLIGAGSLIKDGPGVLTLSGANTFTGMTSVNGGTLALGADNALASSSGLILYGGATFDQSSFSNPWNGKTFAVNSVNGSSAIYNGNLSATNATLHFISNSDMTAPLLTVNGTADISGSSVNINLSGNTILSKETTITLIDSGANALTANNLQKGRSSAIQIGSTIVHDVTIRNQLDQTGNKLTASIGTGRASEESKSLSEGYLGGMGIITNGGALVSDAGKVAAVKVGDDIESGFSEFAIVQGGTTKYNTGSYLDLNSVSLLAGLALGTDVGPGILTTGAFFEYGYGTYNTYNSFDNAPSVKGDGNSDSVGGGVILRLEFAKVGPGKIYAEGMGRIGSLNNKYNSSDLRNAAGVAASYKSTSIYYGANAGMGYLWDISKIFSLDVYAKYFWARLNRSDLTLSTGEALRFGEIDSHNLRIGGRFGYVPHRIVTLYAGAAFEQEFDGKAEATTNGFAIDAPSFAGSTGLGEFGLTISPLKDYDFTIDVGVQGFGGKREGVSGSFQLKFAI